jgi:hypothetical protein
MQELKWACGVTTVPSRIENGMLSRTLKSLEAAGFGKPRLFVDGAFEHQLPDSLQDYEATCRFPRITPFANWTLGLAELFLRHPKADRFGMFQDDCVAVRNLRGYLDQAEWPEKGYWNLYTIIDNEKLKPKDGSSGFFLSDQRGKGAVALVFDRKAVISLLTHQHMVERAVPFSADEANRCWRLIDGGLVNAALKAGWKEWCHFPSLVQHVGGSESAIDAVAREMGQVRARLQHQQQSACFPGEGFDALSLLLAGGEKGPTERELERERITRAMKDDEARMESADAAGKLKLMRWRQTYLERLAAL